MRDTITRADNNATTQTTLAVPTSKVVNLDNLATQCKTTPQRSPSISSQYNNNNKLFDFDLESNNITATPAPVSCTCRKLLSRQPHIIRHCCCNSTTNQAPNKTTSLDTSDYYGYFCEPQPPAKQYQQLKRLEKSHCEHRKSSTQSIPKMLTEPNNNHDNYTDNTESHNGSGGSHHGNDRDEFNADDIDPEEAYYREKVFWCLHRKSKLRHWAIRMTLSPYLFLVFILSL